MTGTKNWTVAVVVMAAAQTIVAGSVAATPSVMTRTLTHEAEAIAALDIISIAPVDAAEKPSRLQEFVVEGTVETCFKGSLRRGQNLRYGLFAEGRPGVPEKTIVFLRHAKDRADVWSAVDGPIFKDEATLRAELRRITKGCRR